jgi:hypothetical protein
MCRFPFAFHLSLVILVFRSTLPLASEPATVALAEADMTGLRDAVSARARAIIDGNKTLFMSLLDRSDPIFLLEQSRWFDYRMSAEISNYVLTAEAAEPDGEGELLATLNQSYAIGPDREAREVRYIERYRRTNGAWRDADLAFTPMETEHFAIRCAIPPGESSEAQTRRSGMMAGVARDAESAWASVSRAWGEAPSGRKTIKLFVDRELLRQNSKITIGRLFNGWGEPGESVKLYLRPEASRSYASVIAHEIIHDETASIARNICSWFAEGLANAYGSFPAAGGSYLDGGYHKPRDYDRSIAWLASLDPERIDDDATWWIYGGMSAAIVSFIADTWGREAPHSLVLALADYPQPDEGYVYSLHDASFTADLDRSIQRILGIGMEELEKRWREWIRRL